VQEMTGSMLLSVASFKSLSFPKDVSKVGERRDWLQEELEEQGRHQLLLQNGQ
jgi:hypothetical protein